MADPLVIPDVDPIALPAPVWLLKALLLLTFLLHVIPMNLVLGGGLTSFLTELLGRKRKSDNHRRLARSFARMIPVAVAFAITLGVAPLLFLQVLYGQLFYTSTILMAWPWLSVIALVILGYYGFYLYYYRWERLPAARLWVVLGSAVLFMAVALIYSNAVTLMLRPETFASRYLTAGAGSHWNLGDPTAIPRYLHFLVGSFAVTGLFVVIYGLGQLRTDESYGRWALRYGAGWFIGATIVQMGVGIWFLVALPRDVMLLFMGGSILGTVLLALGIMLPILSLMLVLLASRSPRPRPMAWTGIGVLAVTLVVMVLIRDLVRDGFLAGKFNVMDRVADPQWGVIALFTVVLVGGLGTVGYLLRRATTATAEVR
jgi:hypothetical protein